ncbi:MAG: SpoVG family protein [Planctomycetota bacterium]
MQISEVRVKLVENRSEKLQAFCTITLDDDFVVRDIKVIDGNRGPFVAMPSRKLTDRCPRCGTKNHLRSKYCNDCGSRQPVNRARADTRGRARLHTDIAHPINAGCREFIEQTILEAFQSELEKAKSPDYVPPNLDEFDDYDEYSPPPEREAAGGS